MLYKIIKGAETPRCIIVNSDCSPLGVGVIGRQSKRVSVSKHSVGARDNGGD
jgi:hypothetical protein